MLCLGGFEGKYARVGSPRLVRGRLIYGRGTASSFFIDETGNATAPAAGPRNWDSAAAHSLIEMLIK